MSRSHKVGRETWKRRRRQVLERDGGRCRLRLFCCTGSATTIDHIVPIAAGGDDGLENLQAACFACNQRKGRTAPVRLKEGPCGRPAYPSASSAWQATEEGQSVVFCRICAGYHPVRGMSLGPAR